MRRRSFTRCSGAAAALAVGSLAACDPMCENDELARAAAPGGAREAIVFQRDCGATTGFSTHVSVVAAGRRLRGGGNVLVVDGDHGRAPAGPGGGPRVEARWLGPATLEVRYDARARVFTREGRVEGVDVRFVADST